MRTYKKTALVFGLLTLMSLVACNPNTNKDNDKEEPDPNLDEDLRTPFNVSMQRGQADKEYETVTPEEVNKTDVWKAFFYAQNYAGNHDYYSVQKGFTDGRASLFSYTQYTYASSVLKGPRALSQFITDGNDEGGEIRVNLAGRQLEDIHNPMGQRDYATLDSRDKAEGIVVNRDENDNVTDAHVELGAWQPRISAHKNRDSFIKDTGHDLFNITNYNVANRSAILTANVSSKDNQFIYNFDFTTSHNVDEGRVDSSKYYQIQQQNIVRKSAPESAEMDITSLHAEMTVNQDWSLSTIKFTETYIVFLWGNNMGKYTTTLDTSFTFLDEGTEIADPAVKSFYDESLEQFNLS